MIAWRVGLLMVLLLAGCQSGGNTELLERQLRIQEDRIYQLEDELQRHCKMLTACRKENQVLKTAGTTSAPTATSAPSTSATKPSSTPPTPIPDLTPPKIEVDLPPLPMPDSSSALPQLNAPLQSELIESAASSGSSLRIRMPQSESIPPAAGKKDERLVDKSAKAASEPSIETAAQTQNGTEKPARHAATPPTQRRPSWSPYR